MKKYILALLYLVVMPTIALGYTLLCDDYHTVCTIGDYTYTGTKTKPVYAQDGVMCINNKTKCTNGYNTITSVGAATPLYTSNGIICKANKSMCIFGKYTFTSTNANKPLIIEDGLLCTYDRKSCTNGFGVINRRKTKE